MLQRGGRKAGGAFSHGQTLDGPLDEPQQHSADPWTNKEQAENRPERGCQPTASSTPAPPPSFRQTLQLDGLLLIVQGSAPTLPLLGKLLGFLQGRTNLPSVGTYF